MTFCQNITISLTALMQAGSRRKGKELEAGAAGAARVMRKGAKEIRCRSSEQEWSLSLIDEKLRCRNR